MFGETPLVIVESVDALREAAARLARSPVLGVDTESDSFHHYQEKVCLLQISDLEVDYVIDPLAVRDLSPLAPIMADRSVVKIFHGADYDVVSLKRDFGFQFANLFDTMIAAQFLGLPRVGLADLIERWFGHVVDKRYQRHDWAERPLLPEHLHYARGDTHFLPALREILTLRLERAGRLRPVLEECTVMEGRAWQGRAHDPSDFLRVKGARQLSEADQRVLRALYAYRDVEAQSMDRPAFKVIPDPVLLELVASKPTSAEAVAAMMRRGSGIARRHGAGIATAVTHGLSDSEPLPQAPPREPRAATRDALRARDAERLLVRLKDWRNEMVQRTGQAPVTVAANGLLREITRHAPSTLEALAGVPDIRVWQIEEHGEAILAIVAEIVESMPEATDGDTTTASAGRRRKRRRGGRGGDSAGPGTDVPDASAPSDD
jgi:ribonuclease D